MPQMISYAPKLQLQWAFAYHSCPWRRALVSHFCPTCRIVFDPHINLSNTYYRAYVVTGRQSFFHFVAFFLLFLLHFLFGLLGLTSERWFKTWYCIQFLLYCAKTADFLISKEATSLNDMAFLRSTLSKKCRWT